MDGNELRVRGLDLKMRVLCFKSALAGTVGRHRTLLLFLHPVVGFSTQVNRPRNPLQPVQPKIDPLNSLRGFFVRDGLWIKPAVFTGLAEHRDTNDNKNGFIVAYFPCQGLQNM